MTETKKPVFNFESERKQLCNQLSYKLRNPGLTLETRKKILKEFSDLIAKIPT